MNPHYQFVISGLGTGDYGQRSVFLDTISDESRLAVSLDEADMEEFTAEWTGLLTSRSRMGFVLLLLLDSLAVTLQAVHLRRNRAEMLEAHLILERGAETRFFALNLCDALALAQLRKLAIFGDESLGPWLRSRGAARA